MRCFLVGQWNDSQRAAEHGRRLILPHNGHVHALLHDDQLDIPDGTPGLFERAS